MNEDATFIPDSFFKTCAIPRIPANFSQTSVVKDAGTSCDWSAALSYKNPLFQQLPSQQKIYLETKPSHFGRSFSAVPYRKIYAYKDIDFLLSIVLFLTVLFAALNAFFRRYLKQFYYASFLYSESARLYNDQNATLPSFFAWLNAMAIIIFSVFLYLVFKFLSLYPSLGSIAMFLMAMFYVIIIYVSRLLIIKITGWLLGKQEIFREYLFQYFLYYKMVALLMFPLLILAIFSDELWTRYSLIIAGVLFLLSHVFIYSRGTKIILKKGIFIFYWILYLCTAEFVPFLMLYKYLSIKV